MGTIVTKTKKIEPLQTYVGNPAKHLKPNSYKADKLTQEQIARYWEIYKEQVKMNKI
jgi:carbonic anhydrase/acetyltransferase-like protein (isoleucine patch superfamily)